MRKYRRMIAKVHMRNAGMTRICSHHTKERGAEKAPSYFSLHWKEWI